MNKSNFISFGKRINWCQRIFNRKCQSQRNEVKEKQNFPTPIIPVRIKRGPTDILKALSSTVGRDPTAPLYKFQDDPYLYPISTMDKKTCALSKESGKKAAKWIRDSNPNLFNHHPDDPVIKEFIPKIMFTEESDVSEKDLLYCINNVHVSDAINVYNMCKTKNVDLSADVRQSLLELVSFYNCKDALDEDWVEERMIEEIDTLIKSKTWKQGGFAEELFNDLKENGSKPYCAIIRGMCQHGEIQGAWQRYQEALKKGLILDTETFNSLIKIAVHFEQVNELKWSFVQGTLAKMVELKIAPNLGTLNALLECLAYLRDNSQKQTVSLQILSEFRNLKIKPSLATYFFLIKIFYNRKNLVSNLIPNLLDVIEKETFEVRDIKDKNFFFAAMDVCLKELKCFQTASRIHDLLTLGDNIKFLSGYHEEIIYKRSYMTMALNSLPLEEFMKIYDDWVPHFFSPSVPLMKDIIRVISLNDNLTLLPRIWSDCILLSLDTYEDLYASTLNVITQHSIENYDKELKKQISNIAWNIWESFQSDDFRSRKSKEWMSTIFADCLIVLVHCSEMEKATQMFSAVIEKPDMILGIIPLDSLKLYFDALVSIGSYSRIMHVLRYCKDNQYVEGSKWAEELCEKESTPEDIKSKLKVL